MSTFSRLPSARSAGVMSQWKREAAANRRGAAPEQTPEEKAAHMADLKAKIRAADIAAGRKPSKLTR